MIPSFARQTVTIINPGVAVEWGHEVADFTDPTETTVVCVWESPTAVTLTAMGAGDAAVGTRVVYVNPGAPVTGHSRLRFPDDPSHVWEVVGAPAVNESPTGAASNVQVTCRRWEAKQ